MKYLLTVGINKYNVAPLRGCVNDSNNIKNELIKKGFVVEQLIDEQATKSNIIDKLTEITSKLVSGDHFIFHYSGHGSQIPGGIDEADGLTEILCPFDLILATGDWSNNFITDDELAAILGSVPENVTVEVLLDCCHSGTGTRDIKPGLLYRYIESKFTKPEDVNVSVTPFNVQQNNDIICWSGCKDIECSADCHIAGSYQGAFTYAFLQSSGPRATRYESIKTILKQYGFPQNPQLTCNERFLTEPVY